MSKEIKLHVIDRDGFVLGYTNCKVGMKTTRGKVSRFTSKTVWTITKAGTEEKHRVYDGRLPSIYKSYVPHCDVQWKS